MSTFKTKRASFVNKHIVETAQVYENTTQFFQQMAEDSVTEMMIFFLCWIVPAMEYYKHMRSKGRANF